MREENINNASFKGAVGSNLNYNHEISGEVFYTFILAVPRQSDNVDNLIVTISERLLYGIELSIGEYIEVNGEIRTYMKQVNNESRLMITIFAKNLEVIESTEKGMNKVEIEGYVCKKPTLRKTPFGKQIGDIMLGVNRKYGQADYLPSILWDRNSELCKVLKIGDKIKLKGRLQSRIYSKRVGNKLYKRTAYEISAVSVIKL